MRTLLYSGIFCQEDERREMIRLWSRMVAHLNPGIDIVIFDSMSPFNPDYYLPKDRFHIHHFSTNPGHLSRGGKDGAGRTFCAGIEYAHQYGYDYCVHLESDMFLARPIQPIIDAMHKWGVRAACCHLPQYQFPEWGIAAFNVRHMIETDFVGRYDWENRIFPPIPEIAIQQLLGDAIFMLPLYGTRNDQNQYNQFNLHLGFPYAPPDFITRVNMPTALRFLELNGIELKEPVHE